MTDLSRHLAAQLPEPPARILLLGRADLRRELEDAGHELVGASTAGDRSLEAEAGPFDAALWSADDPNVDPGAAVALLHRQLSDDGRVIVVVALPAGAPVASRRQGSLPSRHETRLREAVRRLSEAGFAIRKDQDLQVGEQGFKILVARRDPFIVRSYAEGDEDAIQRLFRASFHVDRELDHWRWKYAENPWGGPTLSVAEAARSTCPPQAEPGEFAAHYGGFPIPIWYQGRTFVAFQIGDTMTDPRVRNAGRGKAGLLARTVRHFFSIHRDGSFGFYYGFNTGPIQRFCRWFIGGSQDRPVRYLARDLEPAPSPRRGADATRSRRGADATRSRRGADATRPRRGADATRPRRGADATRSRGGYRVERIEAFGPAFDRLFRRVAPSYRFLVRRDAEYLDWRYRKRPDTGYVILAARRFGRLVGWSVFLRRADPDGSGTHVAWGDALFHPRHLRAAEPILAAALAEPELAGARRVDAWFSGGPPGWDEELARLGFVTGPEPQGLGMIALADAEPEAFERLDEMYTTMGDGDLF